MSLITELRLESTESSESPLGRETIRGRDGIARTSMSQMPGMVEFDQGEGLSKCNKANLAGKQSLSPVTSNKATQGLRKSKEKVKEKKLSRLS